MQPGEERSGWNTAARRMSESPPPEMRWGPESSPHDCVLVLRAAVRTIALLLVAASFLNAQRPLFGTVKAFPVPGFMDRMILLSDKGTGGTRILFWTRGKERAWIGTLNPDKSVVSWVPRQLPEPVQLFIASDINGDGVNEFLFVSVTDSTLFVCPDIDSDTLHASSTIRLPFLPSGILSIKETSGRTSDLLLFSPDNPGILPVTGLVGKNPRLGKIIAPDMAVGAMATAHLNDDGIVDIIAYDWVQSKLHLLYGVGRGRFLDQTTLPVNEGVSQLLATESEVGETLDLVMVSSDSMKILWWHGDGMGDFKPQASYEESSAVRVCRARDLNEDGWPDVVYVGSRGTLHALLNRGGEQVENGPEIAAGMEPYSIEFASAEGPASLVLDRAEKQLLLIEDASHRTLSDSLRFASGLEPSSLLIADVNNDSRPDIVSVTTSGRSLEFHMSDTSGALGGTAVLHLNEEGTWLGLHSISDSIARFIVSSPVQGSVSFVTYFVSDASHLEALIPGVGALEPLFPVLYGDGRVGYYCYGAPGESATSSLSFFQQLDGDRFIERSFKLTIPDVLMGAAVADLDYDKQMDVAYVYRNAATGRYELATAYGDSTGEFSRRGVSFTLPDSSIAKSYLYFADVNGDSILDLLFCFPKNARTIRLALGDSNGVYRSSRKLEEEIRIDNRAQMQLLDLDDDGNVDIVVNDRFRGGVGYLKGNGKGDFDPWKPLYLNQGISHFGFADFNNDGVKDIVVAMRHEGVLTLVDGRLIVRP